MSQGSEGEFLTFVKTAVYLGKKQILKPSGGGGLAAAFLWHLSVLQDVIMCMGISHLRAVGLQGVCMCPERRAVWHLFGASLEIFLKSLLQESITVLSCKVCRFVSRYMRLLTSSVWSPLPAKRSFLPFGMTVPLCRTSSVSLSVHRGRSYLLRQWGTELWFCSLESRVGFSKTCFGQGFQIVYSSVYAYRYVCVLLIGTILKLTKPKPQ